MKFTASLMLGLSLALAQEAIGQIPVLKRSDVVFMYQADRKTYDDYGATVLAWGGRPNAKSLETAGSIKFFGSVGMVTEFNRYFERFPETYIQGVCRDLQGQPFKVPWLTDHQHKGVPYWWCCTRQPLFRQYISERVADTVTAGAFGVHIDDHLGTAGAMGSHGCFCDRCVAEFPAYLATLPKEELAKSGVENPATYNYKEALRAWLDLKTGRKLPEHPLWTHWRIYQFRGAAQFMTDLRALAAKTAGRPVPMSANACLLWGPHLSDYRALDYFSAEIEHHAPQLSFNHNPLVAYRLADAVGRPLASTASGQDWAFIKEKNLPGLVRGWIALGYAAGHSLMAPHRQWCYTSEKGTHWYDGPKESFAPLYRFAHDNAGLFDDYRNYADLTVVFSQRTYDRNATKIMKACNQLAAANLSYRIALGGDAIVDHPLPVEVIRESRHLLVIEPQDFLPADQQVLSSIDPSRRIDSVEKAIAGVKAAASVESPVPVRIFPRVKPGSAVVHLVNWSYDSARDNVQMQKNVRLKLNLETLGVSGASKVLCHAPGVQPQTLSVEQNAVTIPELGLWAIIEVRL